MIKNKKGFTLIETIIAFIVMLIVVSSVSLAITLSLKINREQKMTNLAQNIATDIINKLVRNQSFEYLYNYTDNNNMSIKNNGITLSNRNVNSYTGQVIGTGMSNTGETDKGFVIYPILSASISGSIQAQTFPDLKLLENGTAMLKIYPIITGYDNNGTITPISATSSNIGTPVIEDKKIAVKAVVRWGKINLSTGQPAFKIEMPTVITKNGLYSIPTASTHTPNPSSPSPTPTPKLPNGSPCNSKSDCQSDKCSGNPKICN